MIKDHYDTDFNPNKTPVEIIKEGLFGEYILETFINKCYNDSWKKFSNMIDDVLILVFRMH